jgi:hypothetical protein
VIEFFSRFAESCSVSVCFVEGRPAGLGRTATVDAWCGQSQERLNRELHRYVRTARLVDGDSVIYSGRLLELLDVHLTAMSPQAFTLTGFERVAGVE